MSSLFLSFHLDFSFLSYFNFLSHFITSIPCLLVVINFYLTNKIRQIPDSFGDVNKEMVCIFFVSTFYNNMFILWKKTTDEKELFQPKNRFEFYDQHETNFSNFFILKLLFFLLNISRIFGRP